MTLASAVRIPMEALRYVIHQALTASLAVTVADFLGAPQYIVLSSFGRIPKKYPKTKR